MKFVVTGTATNVLDDWLPVIREIHLRTSAEFEVLFPFPWILSADPTSDLDEISQRVGLRVLVQVGPRVLRFSSIRAARAFFRSKRWSVRARMKVPGPRIDSAEWQAERILLFDWSHRATEGFLGDWFTKNAFQACYALNHGPVPNFPGESKDHGPQAAHFSSDVWRKTVFLGNSATHFPRTSRGERVGIPRHSPSWRGLTAPATEPEGQDLLVFFSRSSDQYVQQFLTDAARSSALQHLAELCASSGLTLGIKRHPHEVRKVDRYDEVLATLGERCPVEFLSESSMSLVQRARGVVVTHSTTALDAIAVGCPVASVRRLAWSSSEDGREPPTTWMESVGLVRQFGTASPDIGTLLSPDNPALERVAYAERIGDPDHESARGVAGLILDQHDH